MIRRSLLALTFVLVACGTDVVEPTYSSISEKIFVPTCATSACHGAPSSDTSLVLTREKGHEQLMGAVDSHEWSGTPWEGAARVVPGNPTGSALMATLEHPVDLPEALMMPTVGGLPKLPDQWIEAIHTWIQNGAKND